MKISFLSMIGIMLIFFHMNVRCQTLSEKKVEVIEGFQNLYKFRNFYLGGQPSLEALKWLRSEGVTRLINIRTESENETFAAEAYNEEETAKSLGYDYHNIPVNSSVDYTPEKLEEISALLNVNEKICIHCRSAVRVTNFFMAYLVQNMNYTVNEAVEIGKELKFTFPLEDILGKEIEMEIGHER